MDKILHSVFRNMTISEVNYITEIWESADIDFWDLVDLYRIDE